MIVSKNKKENKKKRKNGRAVISLHSSGMDCESLLSGLKGLRSRRIESVVAEFGRG